MSTRTRRVIALTSLATTVMICLSGASLAMAGGGPPPPQSPPPTVASTDHTITVTVTDTGFTGGSTGSGGAGGAGGSGFGVRPVPAPCWRYPQDSGKAYYDSVQAAIATSGSIGWTRPDYEKYKDDDKGYWYSVQCQFANWPDQGDVPGYITFVEKFGANYPSEFFPETKVPPPPEVSPEFLRIIAIKSLVPPDPALNWNPKRTGNQGTLVNLDTWFWLDNAPASVQVSATAGVNNAVVTATFGGMDISAPGEAPLHCEEAGTRYTTGASTTCSLSFSRASSALGALTTPVTVKTTWNGTWKANEVPQGAITPALNSLTDTKEIRVDEVQTLVTGAR